MRKAKLTALFAVLALTGCVSMSPIYERPEAPVAQDWPAGPAYEKAILNQNALPDWQTYYTDARLREVISLMLENNRDLRVALLNVEKVRQAYNIQRSAYLPSIAATGSGAHARTPETLSSTGTAVVSHTYTANLAMSSYEIDLFGRIKSLSDQALNEYLATVQAQRASRASMIAQTANVWLTLGADESLLAFAKETLDTQEKTFNLMKASYKAGGISLLNLNQAQTMLSSAKAAYATALRAVAQDKNALTLLVGAPVDEKLLPKEVSVVTLRGSLPKGAPSEVLLNRPDIAQAEYQLKAANANIGAARANFFPRISLVGSYGTGSRELKDLFDSGTNVWSFTPSVSLPIFTGGANIATLRVSEANRDIALANYEKAIQSAFREVADALAAEGTVEETLKAYEELAKASGEAYRLARIRYKEGAESLLVLLDTQRSYVSARSGL
ncbi:MAG TPA: multidrug transporter, partial [Sutterella sp.]|nr:multidrug transporter [Sutterella sp.]